MSSWSWKAGLASLAIVVATTYAVAQIPPGHAGMHGQIAAGDQDQPTMPPRGATPGAMDGRMKQMMQEHQGMHGEMDRHGMMGTRRGTTGQPTMPGQDAFGAIQEIVQILEADPTTDWSKVNIAALREHLVDMNEVTLRAVATELAKLAGDRLADVQRLVRC